MGGEGAEGNLRGNALFPLPGRASRKIRVSPLQHSLASTIRNYATDIFVFPDRSIGKLAGRDERDKGI